MDLGGTLTCCDMTTHLFEWCESGGLEPSLKTFGKLFLWVFLPFSQFMRHNVGEGSKIYFWEDFWVGDKHLCILLLHYIISQTKVAFCSFSVGFL